jgi:hypothetical protein
MPILKRRSPRPQLLQCEQFFQQFPGFWRHRSHSAVCAPFSAWPWAAGRSGPVPLPWKASRMPPNFNVSPIAAKGTNSKWARMPLIPDLSKNLQLPRHPRPEVPPQAGKHRARG